MLRHESTGIEAEANERRSQSENRQVALFRLRVRLAVEFRTARSSDAVPSELWRSRCCNGRVSVNPSHPDFPALLAEALDVLAMCNFEHSAAALDLADRLQTPVFVMLDLEIGMNERLTAPLTWDDSRRMDRGKVMTSEELEAGRVFGRYLDVDGDGVLGEDEM